MQITTKYTLAASALSLLAACGGGGGSAIESNLNANKYAGKYSYCEEGIENILVVSDIDGKSVNISPTEIHYKEADCKGEILGTYTEPLPTKFEYTSTGTSLVRAVKNSFPLQYEYSAIAKIPSIKTEPLNGTFELDKFTLKLPAMTATFVGSSIINGCLDNYCYDLNIPAAVSASGASSLYLSGKNLFVLRLENGVYVGTGSYIKQ